MIAWSLTMAPRVRPSATAEPWVPPPDAFTDDDDLVSTGTGFDRAANTYWCCRHNRALLGASAWSAAKQSRPTPIEDFPDPCQRNNRTSLRRTINVSQSTLRPDMAAGQDWPALSQQGAARPLSH
jgi:hypothetical protein